MELPHLEPKEWKLIGVVSILLFFSTIEIISGYLKSSKRASKDWIQELGSLVVLGALIEPGIVLFVIAIGATFFPEYSTLLSSWNPLLILFIYLLVEDFFQYWYHRNGHVNPFFWKLHRAHHQAEEMGFFVSYRNAGLFYVMMPNVWWMGLVTFLGGGTAVIIGIVLKQLIIISSHSTVKWDKPFYENKLLLPIILLLERIIITPSFHHVHHGVSKQDGVGNPNGNFGNMLSIWDQLFGTASFPHAYPDSYGLQTKTDDHWSTYLYPIVKSKDNNSELAAGFKKSDTSTMEPLTVDLVKGEKYLWCKCGMSKTQPFCDGSHHGTKHIPEAFESKVTGKAKLCNCKLSKKSPFCDNTHLKFTEDKK